MPRLYPLQTSFSAGEISPLLYSRYDLDGYKNGVRDMVNMWPDPKGPARSRGGSVFSSETPGSFCKLGTLQIADSSFFVLKLLEQELHISTVTGGPLPADQLVNNFSFLRGCADWTGISSGAGWVVNCLTGAIQLIEGTGGGGLRESGVRQQVTVTDTGETHRLQVLTNGRSNYRVRIGTTAGGEDIHTGIYNLRRFELDFPAGVLPGSIWVEVSIDNSFANGNITIDQVSLAESESKLVYTAPWAGVDVEEIQLVPAPNGETIYFLHRSYAPYKLIYDTDTGSFDFKIVAFVGAPVEWDTGNYPGTGVIAQGRFWLGGTPRQKETFWGSKSGAYEDLTAGTNADDGMVFTMERYGAIRWMYGLKNLLIGTATGEYIVTSDQGLITPSDIQVIQQSSYGSAQMQPQQVGDLLFYVAADNSKVRAMQYEWSADNYLSQDLSFAADHITQEKVRGISWNQNPNNHFMCRLATGEMAYLVYERGNNIYGWSKFKTEGRVIAITSGSYFGVNVLVLAVIRNEEMISIEYIIPDTRTDLSPYFMDALVEQQSQTETTTFGPYPHLANKTVQVLANNAVHPDVDVDADGYIELDYPALTIIAGLPMIRTLRTLPIDPGAPGTGSAASWLKRRNKIFLRLSDSAKPKINGTRPATRHPLTPMNTAEPERSEDIFVANLGWDRDAMVHIEQDLPLDLTILGVFGEIEENSI